MKLLKNKKFWAITLGVTLVGAGVVAVAASCSSSNVKSKLSSQLVKSKDEKSFYAVYDIENFDDLNENDKKALNEAEFNVAITSAENKTENATTKGHLLNKKIYVKLPREPKAKEQLTIINKGGLLKTASLVLPDNLNYQTEKVEFENTPTPTPKPTPTPTPKEDKAVVSSVELVDKDATTKKAKVKLTFSKALVVANETTPSLKLTLTKKGAQETKEVELVLSADKLSVTTKDLVEFATDTYNVSKLMINDVEANVDAIKSSDLKVAEETPKQEDKAVVSSVELVDKDATTKKAKVKLTFSKALVVANETTPSLKLTLTKKGAQETKEVELVLSADKLSVTTKDLVEFATDTYNVSKLMINDVEANVDAIKSSDLKVAEEQVNPAT
ncbi:hypothetical protein LLZ88_01945 [Ureaplasma urealyticum]|uniref:MBA family surface membrane protein n=1 Tax=Ureaplasma urealyticum TaxID=2130 RepID=UPI001F3E5B33|nr:hypothetical protein [Ureaplasma urealyticum]UIU14833.1 hypothetical protein LLZ88_01945 [Ureaplasma urealyticum]